MPAQAGIGDLVYCGCFAVSLSTYRPYGTQFWAHACMGGGYCDLKRKFAAEPLPYWPPVFTQANDYR